MKIKKLHHIEKQLLCEIQDFCEDFNISENSFGIQVVNSNKLVKRLRAGKGVWSTTINAARDYIAAHRKSTTK